MTIRDDYIKKGLINRRNKNLDKLEEVLDKLKTHYLKKPVIHRYKDNSGYQAWDEHYRKEWYELLKEADTLTRVLWEEGNTTYKVLPSETFTLP